jgi:hypothetical protein
MAIAYSNSYSGTIYSGETVSRSFTVGTGNYRYLLAFLYGYAGSDAACNYTSVQYNGVSMTLAGTIGTNRYGNYCKCSVYYLLAPTSGANNFTCQANASLWNGGVHLLQLSGVEQTAPEATNTNYDNTSSLTSFSSSVTTITNNAWVIDGFLEVAGTASSLAANSGQTARSSPLSLTSTVGAGLSTELQPTAGSETQGWTWTTSSNMVVHYLLSLAPAHAGISIETGNIAQGNAGSTTSHILTTSLHRGVIVLIDDESTSQASGVTYNGVAMTLVTYSTSTVGVGNASSMWVILEANLPAGGSSYNVVVSGLDSGASVTVVEINNIAQVVPSGAQVDTTESGDVSSSSTTVTAPTGESISVGALGYGNDVATFNSPSGTGTWTRMFTIYNPPTSAHYGGAYQIWSTGGSKTYTESVDTTFFRASHIQAVFAIYGDVDNAPYFGCNF